MGRLFAIGSSSCPVDHSMRSKSTWLDWTLKINAALVAGISTTLIASHKSVDIFHAAENELKTMNTIILDLFGDEFYFRLYL